MTSAAAQQSVNINPNVFFTLSTATFTSETAAQTFNFTLSLTNHSTQTIDLNQYGVKVVDKEGMVYAAQLAEKANANVAPQVTADYKYVAQVPKNVSASQLSVHVFAWDFSLPTAMRSLGNLDAAPALSIPLDSSKQVIVNLNHLVPILPQDTSAAFSLVRSYKVLKDGVWSIYTDLMVDNQSSNTIHIPANLAFSLQEDSTTADKMDLTSGGSQAILAKQQNLITLHASLIHPLAASNLVVVLADSSKAALGSFALDGSFTAAAIGTNQKVSTKNINAFDMAANQVTYTSLAFGIQAHTQFTLTNSGQTVLTVPVITAAYQVAGTPLSSPANQADSHPATLNPGQSTTYDFTQTLPKNVDSTKIQLVVSVKVASGIPATRPIDVITLPEDLTQTTAGNSSVTTALSLQDFDPTLPDYANVSLQVVRSYHVTANSNPAINVDLLAVNASANAIKLPASLLFNLKDSTGASYQTTALSGADLTIEPHQSVTLSLQAVVAVKDASTQYSLDFVKKGNPATVADIVYSSLDLGPSFAVGSGSNTVNTALGRMGITLASTYRLASQSGEDILMSEVQIQNLDNKVLTLPTAASFYGGYMIGDFDAQGTIVNLQTSAILAPNQTTTVYIYTKIPYTTPLAAGYIYIGEGTLNAPTKAWTETHEWTELPFTAAATPIPAIALNRPWTIADAGRASTGQIVDSQIYDINNQKMLAIRIVDTNKEARNGTILPYTGYVTNANGTIVTLSTMDDSANTKVMGTDSTAMTTLWAVLPAGSSTTDQQAVFGPKVEDQTFAEPQQYAFAPATASNTLQNASVYPYTISVQNTQLTTSTAGGSGGGVNYDVNFDYAIANPLPTAGSTLDRGLEFTLTNSLGKVVKTWDYAALEGTGALITGRNKLTVSGSDFANSADLVTFLSYARQLNVYEKFEGGTRLLGSIAVSF